MIDDFYVSYTAVLSAAFTWSLALDWRQTLAIFGRNSRWRELNPVINWITARCRTPARGVHLWFTLTLVSVMGAAWTTKQPWGAALLLAFTLIEAGFVASNARLGIKV